MRWVRFLVILVAGALVGGGQLANAQPANAPGQGSSQASSAAKTQGRTITGVDWLKKPNEQDMEHYWPAAAMYRSGKASIECAVTTRGALEKCKILSEEPSGQGFGQAALAMAPLFMMKPKTVDGEPVSGASVVIPIHFEGGAPYLGMQAVEQRVYSSLPWDAAPTAAELKAAYPSGLIGKGTRGRVVMRCRPEKDGTVGQCDAVVEEPTHSGFAGAARGLIKSFRMADDPDLRAKLKDAAVDIPFDFIDPRAPQPPVELADILWLRGADPKKAGELFPPEAAKAGLKTGVGVVDCAVDHAGRLTDCTVARENPPGLGFGEAALVIANVMAMNPWTTQGVPVDGARVKVPIRLNLDPDSPLAAASDAPAPAAQSAVTTPSGTAAASADPADKALALASEVYREKDFEGAAVMAKAIVGAPNFGKLTASQRHAAQSLYGGALLGLRDYPAALLQLKAATASDADAGADWAMRFKAEVATHDDADALLSLTTVARRWPAALTQIDDQSVVYLWVNTRDSTALAAKRIDMLDALYAAHRTLRNPFDTPDALWLDPNSRCCAAAWYPFDISDVLWLDLTLALLDKGQTEKARAVAENIIGPRVVAYMRIDRRYDPVTTVDPERYDVAKAAARWLGSLQTAASAAPDKLAEVNALADCLRRMGRAGDALALLDEAIKRAHPAEGGQAPFVDMDKLNWTYDGRADALMALGRGAEAIESMTAGAQRPERGDSNFSQKINLAGYYVMLGRPSEALKVINEVPNLITYGGMAREEIRAYAYAQLHDLGGLNRSVGYMKTHAADAPQLLIGTLIEAGEMDEAAREVIKQLGDRLQRTRVLTALQDDLIPETAPDFTKRHHRLVVALRQRADVKAAIDKVGRIETIPYSLP